MKQVKWYHFWNPQSGLVGGFIFGSILVAASISLGVVIAALIF